MNIDTGREVASGRFSKGPGFGVAGARHQLILTNNRRAKYPSRKLSPIQGSAQRDRELDIGVLRSLAWLSPPAKGVMGAKKAQNVAITRIAEGDSHTLRANRQGPSAKCCISAGLVWDLGFSTHRGVILKWLVCDSGGFTHQGVQSVRHLITP